MLDIARLQAFVHAAESLSFSEAAKHLNLTQPTISHHIKVLETTLGVELFDRSHHALRLTEAGKTLLPRARKLVKQSVEIQQIMGSLDHQLAGHLQIACSTTAGKYILPMFAARFRQKNPGTSISILRCTSEHVLPQLMELDADIGVVSHGAYNEEFEGQPFFVDHVILIVPPDHPWATLEIVSPSDLLDEPFLIRESESGTRRVMLNELNKHDISLDDMNIFMEMGTAEAIVKTVATGYGVSFVSRLAANFALDQGAVVEVNVEDFELHRQIYMVRRNLREAHRVGEAFWGFIHHPDNADLLNMAH